MLYEFATLSFHPLNARKATAGAEAYVAATEAKGQLLGCWTTDIGALGRLFVLRGFTDAAELAAERKRALFSANPFGAAEVLTGLEMDSYAPFPFLPPVVPGKYGKIYEFRTYHLKPGGLPPTMAAWEAAMPARNKLSPLVINMYALDGAPRITHIWPMPASTRERRSEPTPSRRESGRRRMRRSSSLRRPRPSAIRLRLRRWREERCRDEQQYARSSGQTGSDRRAVRTTRLTVRPEGANYQ
jgi:hypothetical protein